MAEGKPTLHHLNNSQSQFILWLLEELQIPYNLELYERNKSGANKNRAPDSMKKIHPLGHSPTLVTPEGRVIIERSAIALYLITTYDKEKRFQGDPAAGDDAIRDDMLASYGGSSLSIFALMNHILDLITRLSPFVVRPMFAATYYILNKAFLAKEMATLFAYLEQELGDREYFMGKSPGRADFLLLWPIDFSHQLHYIDLQKYPKLLQFHERCIARDGWKRAMEKGNGYDLPSLLK